ncbi:hypothetical protein [Mariniflexile sp.]|uniref:hypothetical protein n=1 Tax=Mariniflexile sp. TaxID=1979402 RepID=UPI0035660570
MNIQILPNWCKKLGLIVFIIFSILIGRDDFVRGFKDAHKDSDYSYDNTSVSKNKTNLASNDNDTLFLNYFGKPLMHLFEITCILGMIIYMISKEKIEDDYIIKLRLESYQLTTLMFLITTIILFALYGDLNWTLSYFINLFIILYLLVFFIKKRVY